MCMKQIVRVSVLTAATFGLFGCASAWISHPSPQVKNLVNDLRLDGFECKSRTSDIECRQIQPMREKQPSKCDSKNGCIDQPYHLLNNVYVIKEQANGIPKINHRIDRQVEGSFFGGKVK